MSAERAPLLGSHGESGSNNWEEVTEMLKEFVTLVNSIESGTKLIGKRQDSADHRAQLKKWRSSASDLAKTLTQYLKAPTRTPQEKQKQSRLSDQFTSAIERFKAAVQNCIEAEGNNPIQTKHQDDDIEYGDSRQFGNQKFKEIDYNAVDRELLKEQNEDFKELQSELSELVETYKEVNELLGEQKEQLDVSESYVNTADSNVEQAVHELQVASEYQTSARKKKICIGIFLGLVCLAILIVVVVVIAVEAKKF